MVVTINVETQEERDRRRRGRAQHGQILLVPRIEGRYAAVGTVGEIQQIDEDGNIVVAGRTAPGSAPDR